MCFLFWKKKKKVEKEKVEETKAEEKVVEVKEVAPEKGEEKTKATKKNTTTKETSKTTAKTTAKKSTAKPAVKKEATKPATKKTVKETKVEKDEEKPQRKASSSKVYHVSLRKDDGKWQVKYGGGKKAIKLFDTQAEAIKFAEERADSQDGSISIHKKDGKIRKQDYSKKAEDK